MTKLRAPLAITAESPLSTILGMVLIVAAIAFFITRSGAIEALSGSGLLP